MVDKWKTATFLKLQGTGFMKFKFADSEQFMNYTEKQNRARDVA